MNDKFFYDSMVQAQNMQTLDGKGGALGRTEPAKYTRQTSLKSKNLSAHTGRKGFC